MEQELTGTPRPHYLESVEELSVDGKSLRGWVLFPSTDHTIADRVDHVNVAHHLFAVWNAAHLMCGRAKLQTPRAFETETISRRPTLPDKRVLIEAQASIDREDSGRVFGSIAANFSDEGRRLCEVKAKFVARRVL